ncbi:N-acetylmuramoyl-L-alanine amidase family protein [Desulfolutivibrio sp.]|uniref:N-acetylmuramoyl-L-alanine amidase family protein n=1 Tax=Desulfolutivibrio sp. TaxID=2773296 RepID=UPI002F966557
MSRLAATVLVLLLFTVPVQAASTSGRPAKSLADTVVAVDVGHSLKRSGATSARGVPEYRFNLELARLVVAELHAAGLLRAFLLDEAGADIPPAGRATLANRKKADLLVSIHHDSVQPHYLATWPFEGRQRKYCDRFSGYSLFFSAKNPASAASIALGKSLGESLRSAGFTPTAHHAEPIPGEGRELIDPERGLYRYDGLAVLSRAKMPAVLVEAGVIVNRDEETSLTDPARRERMARAIAQGVANHAAAIRP